MAYKIIAMDIEKGILDLIEKDLGNSKGLAECWVIKFKDSIVEFPYRKSSFKSIGAAKNALNGRIDRVAWYEKRERIKSGAPTEYRKYLEREGLITYVNLFNT